MIPEETANGHLKGAGPAVFGLLFFPVSWVIESLANTAAVGVENTPSENLDFALPADILALMICGGFALWVHKQAAQRSLEGHSGAFSGGWIFARPTVWFIRALACAVIGLSLASGVRQGQRERQSDVDTFFSYVYGSAPLAARDATNQFVVPLGVVEAGFPAVSEASRGSVICWQPDGTQFGGPTQNPGKAAGAGGKARSLVLTVRLTSASEIMPYLPFVLLVAGKKVALPSVYCLGDRDYVWFSAGRDTRLLDVRLGKPVGEWQNTYAGWEWNGKMPRRPERVISHAGQEAVVALGQVGDSAAMGASATWTSSSIPAEWVGRLVAVDDAGIVHLPAVDRTELRGALPLGTTRIERVTFNGLTAARIKELRFQIRPCQWVEVRNISLEPGRRTQVEVVDGGEAQQYTNALNRTTPAPITPRGLRAPPERLVESNTLILTGTSTNVSTVSFELGPKYFKDGDLIVIEQVAATSPLLTVGDKVTVRGRYVLKSEERARLCLYLTASNAVGAEPDFPTQKTEITKGSGSFELAEEVRHPGHLHLSFYRVPGGRRFGTVYFGTAQQMKEISNWKLDD